MKKLYRSLLIYFLITAPLLLNAQLNSQTVRGIVMDKDTRIPLPGANVIILNTEPVLGAVSDINGKFRIEKVAVGRQSIRVSFMGYEDYLISQTEVLSGKELVLQIEMKEKIYKTGEVVITANDGKENPINEMSILSTRSFSIEETNRFAGAWGDPSRMVSNFAGVSIVSDKRNDIIVRGNSPVGVLWMLDGFDIPNPNHFAVAGSSGGAISMINNNLLDNSDFATGAFSAEYGNATSAVFDLRMRNGNNEQREYIFQVGAHGFELGTEGPFRKGKQGSYMANYRYSTLALLDLVGITLIDAVPVFQDATLKFHFPHKKGSVSFFALGGRSKAVYHPAKDSLEWDNRNDQEGYYSGSDMAVGGLTIMNILSKSTYLKILLSSSIYSPFGIDDSTGFDYNVYEQSKTTTTEWKNGLALLFNSKISSRHILRWGAKFNHYSVKNSSYYITYQPLEEKHHVNTFSGDLSMIQAFFQYKYNILENLTLNTGLHWLYLMLNGKSSIEPRAAIRWNIAGTHSISAGFGLHGLMQPIALYNTQQEQADGSVIMPNRGLGFTQSYHYVVGYDVMPWENIHASLEAYYQDIKKVPVSVDDPVLSMLNFGTADNIFSTSTFRNSGKGRNYGIEATVEKFLTRGNYFLVTISLFQSQYTGNDGIERNTRFNCRYAANVLAGQEFRFGKKKNNIIGISTTIVMVGGQRYTPIDLDASRLAGREIRIDSLAFTEKFKDFFKVDLTLKYTHNARRLSHEFAIEASNIFNRKNIEDIRYNPATGELRYGYQLPLVPLFYYRLMF